MTAVRRVRAVGGGLFIPLAWPAVVFLLLFAYSGATHRLPADARWVYLVSGVYSFPCAAVAVGAWCLLWWNGTPSRAATAWAGVALVGALVAWGRFSFWF